MKTVLLSWALMVLLSMQASAENDSVTNGPYKVSFDLGFNHSEYNITIAAPQKKEALNGDKSTFYAFIVKNNTDSSQNAIISLTQ
jgi:lipocalin